MRCVRCVREKEKQTRKVAMMTVSVRGVVGSIVDEMKTEECTGG